jgi:hypothetical protein
VNRVAVCTQPELAATLTTAGVHVVLCAVPPPVCASHAGSASPSAARTDIPKATTPEAGRLAVLAGDPDRPEAMEAAVAMARELFGAEPMIVRTAADSARLLARVPSPKQG